MDSRKWIFTKNTLKCNPTQNCEIFHWQHQRQKKSQWIKLSHNVRLFSITTCCFIITWFTYLNYGNHCSSSLLDWGTCVIEPFWLIKFWFKMSDLHIKHTSLFHFTVSLKKTFSIIPIIIIIITLRIVICVNSLLISGLLYS